MAEIQYVGEHLLPGQLGHFLIILGFTSAFFAFAAYFMSARHENDNSYASWLKLGRVGFILHGVATLCVIGTIFYIMVNHMYEYRYAWEHVSDDLDLKYILSAFWEGQEGSLLLWMFWHIILGFVAIRITGKWEAPVLAVVALVQLIMGIMLLGVHIEIGDFSYKFGSNPFALLRDTMQAPIFQNAEYLSLVTGEGLNPLLQNIWNTIHPPIIFLGFASLTLPFAYAIAALWNGKHTECMDEVLKWSLFSGGILGSGILMGSAWAYVALSFGGYWAWDPVENASLVPWIMLIGGLHTNYIARSTKRSIGSTYLFYIFAFVLILYSTFLTRSGVLGDTSAHAFTEMGLEWQLVGLVASFLILGMVSYVYNYSSLPKHEKEESIYSREFWLFIGSLVLLFSSVLITGSTSLPVYNSIVSYFNPDFVGNVINDPVPHYNKYQLWIAVFISFLSAFSLFLRYRASSMDYFKNIKFWRHIGIATIGAILLTLWYNYFYESFSFQNNVLMFATAFSVVASIDYMFSVLKGNFKLGAAAISHFGFSVMIMGSLITGLNQRHISTNPFIFSEMFTTEDAQKYVTLLKEKPMFMSNYWVKYERDSLRGFTRTYEVSFRTDKNSVEPDFTLYPDIVYNKSFSKIAALNPDTKMFWNQDIFADIVALHPSLQDAEFAKEMEDTMKFVPYNLVIGEPLKLKDYTIEYEGINKRPQHKEFLAADSDLGVEAVLKVSEKLRDTSYMIQPALGLKGQLIYTFPIKSQELESVFKIDESFFDQIYTAEQNLSYTDFELKEGEIFKHQGYTFKLIGFEKSPEHSEYEAQEGDLAIGAKIEVYRPGFNTTIEPIYIIRGNQPLSIKEYILEEGIHVRFTKIDPTNGVFSFTVAKEKTENKKLDLPLMLAENVDRTDYIVFRARVFPAINLFWIGSLTMLFGLFLALYNRNREK